MNTATALVEMLHRYEVRHIFGVPGDTSLAFYEALRADGRIAHIMARDERTAGFMADAYARLTTRPGVCEAPSGAGATYLLPGLAEATGSSVPFLALTSDVPVGRAGPRDADRAGPGSADAPGEQVDHPPLAPRTVARNGAPGLPRRHHRTPRRGPPQPARRRPPRAVSRRTGSRPLRRSGLLPCPGLPGAARSGSRGRSRRTLAAVGRPVILAGGGAVLSGCQAELTALAELLDAPVATTITGKGAIAETHPLSLGVAGGNGGRPYANIALATAPLVLLVGCKANEVATQRYTTPRRHGPPIIQIDVDPQQLGNTYPLAVALCGDARLALADLLTALGSTISDEAGATGRGPPPPKSPTTG